MVVFLIFLLFLLLVLGLTDALGLVLVLVEEGTAAFAGSSPPPLGERVFVWGVLDDMVYLSICL